MRRTTLFATTALLTLSLAPALQAQRGYPDRDRDRYGYDRGRVADIAREIDENASYAYREFARNNRRPNRAEARVLSDLRQLDQRAERFRYEIRDNNRGSRDSRQDAQTFAALEDAFFEAAESLRYINDRPYVDRGMDRIYTLLNEVSRSYGRGYRTGYDRWDRGRGWNRSDGRYGRDERRYGQERYRDYYKDGN